MSFGKDYAVTNFQHINTLIELGTFSVPARCALGALLLVDKRPFSPTVFTLLLTRDGRTV